MGSIADMITSIIIPILVTIGACTFIVGFLNILKALNRHQTLMNCLKDPHSVTFYPLICGLIVMFTCAIMSININSTRWTTAIDNGYTVYIDGQEVDPSHIDRSDYHVNYDDENEQILLSQRRNGGVFFFFTR